jgi:hypothetical protein
MVIPVPVNVAVFVLFGLGYGGLLGAACGAGVYRVSGLRWLDRGLLVWLVGLFAGVTVLPALYLALSFDEFGPSPVGRVLTRRLRWLAWGQLVYLGLYALLVLLTVRQR